jgi:hypothetical protein
MPAFFVVAKPFLGGFEIVTRKSGQAPGFGKKMAVKEPVHIWRQNEAR